MSDLARFAAVKIQSGQNKRRDGHRDASGIRQTGTPVQN